MQTLQDIITGFRMSIKLISDGTSLVISLRAARRAWRHAAKSLPGRSAVAVQKKWTAMKRRELENAQSDPTIDKYISLPTPTSERPGVLYIYADQLVHVHLPGNIIKSFRGKHAQLITEHIMPGAYDGAQDGAQDGVQDCIGWCTGRP